MRMLAISLVLVGFDNVLGSRIVDLQLLGSFFDRVVAALHKLNKPFFLLGLNWNVAALLLEIGRFGPG